LRRAFYAVVLLLALTTARALAQSPATATLRVTVLDPSNAIVPGATVTLTGAEDATKGSAIPPVRSGDDGVATIPGLKPGRYAVQAEFPGFEARVLPELRLRTATTRIFHRVTARSARAVHSSRPRGPRARPGSDSGSAAG
jgi:hypothetical protein